MSIPNSDPWMILRYGYNEEALQQIRRNFEADGSASQIMELGVAYLWLEMYQEAWEHFDATNSRYPKYTTTFYGMAGVAKWCLNEPKTSVSIWQQGLNCRFADSNGAAVELPLLLYMASVTEPNLFSKFEAEKLLEAKADDKRCQDWPAPLVKFLLGRFDEQILRNNVPGTKEIAYLREWYANFYIAIRNYASIGSEKFQEKMSTIATTTDDDFDLENHRLLYLGKLWNEVYFIARHFDKRFR